DETEPPPPAGPWKTRPAPWAGWFDRHRFRLTWGSLVQALVFYGWLRGLNILHQGSPAGQSRYGVGLADAPCWFSAEDWQVDGEAGNELAEALWQAWLRAGGPWPTEFHLTASAAGGLEPQGPETFLHQGPRCQQLWELPEPRERPGWR